MAPIFAKLVISLSGTFPGHKHGDLQDIIEANGGTYSPKLSDSCTHLISTQREVDNNGTKNKQAMSVKGIKVVRIEWLLDSVQAKKRSKETTYLFTALKDASVPVANSGTTNASQNNNQANQQGTKRLSRANSQKASAPIGSMDSVNTSRNKTQSTQPGAKRDLGLDSDDEAPKASSKSEPPKKKQKDAQKTSSTTLRVPVDEAFPSPLNHSVYIDDNGLIFDATLNQTNASNNNNKFYRIQLLSTGSAGKYITWTRWGRVGENGQKAAFHNQSLDSAKAIFERKFKDKSGLTWENRLDPPKKGKYTFIERNYEDDSEDEDESEKIKDERADQALVEVKPAESVLPPAVQDLVGLIFNQVYFETAMAAMSYDSNKLPLGKLSKRTLRMGFQVLKDLSELVTTPSIAQELYNTSFLPAAESLSNQYFTVIPHVFGRDRPPVISTPAMIKREVDLLETLTDMGIANEILKDAKAPDADNIHPLDRQFAGLDLEEMTPLASESTEFKELANYLIKSHGQTHYLKYKVEAIFRLERRGENTRFLQSPYAKIKNSNRRLLWHGSRTTNFGGILSQGLRIAPPEAPVSGYMFGKGVYFADISSKSANYCWASNSNNTGLLLLCDVELGDPMLELVNGNYNADALAKKEGKLATLGVGRTAPVGWKDAGCVHKDLQGVLMPDVGAPPGSSSEAAYLQYNEYIVYDIAQVRQKYLLRVKMT